MPNEDATFHPNPSRPSFTLPTGAWDAHCHVFGPTARFPYAPTRGFTPPEAPKEKLFALHAMLGITRCVIVQSSVHGFDNSAVENALSAKAGAYRGIALLAPDVAEAEITRLSARGFRGVRFNYIRHLGTTPPIGDVIRFAHRLADHGWPPPCSNLPPPSRKSCSWQPPSARRNWPTRWPR
ncbi:MAG: amidohydrolase family protein [Acetobacteraceae bacterium]